MGDLSKYFTIAEFERSNTAIAHKISNHLDSGALHNASLLAKLFLDPLREYINKGIILTSGYRGPTLNRLVGGSSSSAHCIGCAADIYVSGMPITKLYEQIYKAVKEGIIPEPDQVIWEKNSWVHFGIRPNIKENRGQWLKYDGKSYTSYPIHEII